MNDIIIPVRFTKREIEVLRLVCDGLSNHEIGARLKISRYTSRWYLHNLYLKTGINPGTGGGSAATGKLLLLKWGVENGIIKLKVKRAVR